MGSDENHFTVSVDSDGQVSTNHNLFEEKSRAEAVSNRGPSAYQPNALPLGHTGSHDLLTDIGWIYSGLIAWLINWYKVDLYWADSVTH